MSRHVTHVPLLARTLGLARRYRADKRGVAAIEFALILPIMFVMFVGAVELSQAITVDRRVTQAASSVADLVARKEKSISTTEISDIMKIGGYIMEPYSHSAERSCPQRHLLVRRTPPPTKQSWPCSYSATGETATPSLRVHERDLQSAARPWSAPPTAWWWPKRPTPTRL